MNRYEKISYIYDRLMYTFGLKKILFWVGVERVCCFFNKNSRMYKDILKYGFNYLY